MDVPTDMLVNILLRLSPICRRRVRLVCRLWRNLIHERTPKIQIGPPKPLIETDSRRAYIVDDTQGRGRCTPLWTDDQEAAAYMAMQVVGTCNGLLCLCDNYKPGGPITLVNPATGEALGLPPTPGAGQFSRPKLGWQLAYGFAYHSVTGRYKILHVSCYQDKVQVFALGEASWRDVPSAPINARCRLDAGVIGLDGAAYWVTVTERIMSLDLEDDRVVLIESPPAQPVCHLAEVRGTLAAVTSDGVMAREKVQVWVLEGERTEPRWTHLYNMEMPSIWLHFYPLRRPGQRLGRPHLGHGVSTVLTHGTCPGDGLVLYEPTPTSSVQTQQWKPRQLDSDYTGRIFGMFSYTETTEPLSDYKVW